MPYDEKDFQQLTIPQAVVLSIMTGGVLIPFKFVLADVIDRLGRNVSPSEFRNPVFIHELQELYRPDFLRLVQLDPVEIIIAKE